MQKKFLEDSLSTTIGEWLRYHQKSLHFNQKYKGLKMLKNPFDLIVYEEILWEIKPEVVIEIGSSQGGFALWLRDHSQIINTDINTKIITIDLNNDAYRSINSLVSKNIIHKQNVENIIHKQNVENIIHKQNVENIIFMVGDCNSPEILSGLRKYISKNDIVLVIEDSSHSFENTFRVLENYKDIVSVNSYFIIEDGISDVLNFGPVPGPMRAIEKWIVSNPNYQIDRSKERYIMTYNPKGYLKRMY